MIRNFNDNDIVEASKFAQLTWGDFYTNQSEQLQQLIYHFMVSYYDLNRTFSFSSIDDKYNGFLLAANKFDKNNAYLDYERKVHNLKNENEQKIALELLRYLDDCGNKVKNLMSEKDLMLGLFVSIKKGCGKLLLAKLVETASIHNIENIYLWSDTSCDYEYYRKNNFLTVKEFSNFINNKPITTLIFKKSL